MIKKVISKNNEQHYIGEELYITVRDGRYVEKRPFTIIDILDKGKYNMYVCRDNLGGYKETFTDFDLKILEEE